MKRCVANVARRACSSFERADGSPIDITGSMMSGSVGGPASAAFESRWDTIFAQKKQTRDVTNIFSQWCDDNRDEGMHRNHQSAVDAILERPVAELSARDERFSVVDAGCGNGWLARQISQLDECESACGIDGSRRMIAKAEQLTREDSETDGGSSQPTFVHAALEEWRPVKPVTFVFSMEVLYYHRDPVKLLTQFRSWLADDGVFASGVDFFGEHAASHTWPAATGLPMTLLSEAEWHSALVDAGFMDVSTNRIGNTLALYGRR